MKDYLNIKIPKNTKIAVIGDVHEQLDHFNILLEKIKPSNKMILVSVGDLADKGGGMHLAEAISDKIQGLHTLGHAYIVKGNHELKHIRKATKEKRLTSQLEWLSKQPLALSFMFDNGTRATVVHGGVKPSNTWDNISSDIEIAYIRDLDENGKMIKLNWVDGELVPVKPGGITWHNLYDGRFGYIFSGHNAQKDGLPKFYNYSCNIDTACYLTNKLTCQIFSSVGLEELITIEK